MRFTALSSNPSMAHGAGAGPCRVGSPAPTGCRYFPVSNQVLVEAEVSTHESMAMLAQRTSGTQLFGASASITHFNSVLLLHKLNIASYLALQSSIGSRLQKTEFLIKVVVAKHGLYPF